MPVHMASCAGAGPRRRKPITRPGAEPLEARRMLAVFVVTSANDSGPGSLRQAILDANATPEQDALSIGPGSIHLLSPLPAITAPLTMRGSVELDGSNAGPGADGLTFAAGAADSSVDGFAINRFGGSGVVVQAPRVRLTGCRIGADLTGNVALGNGTGPGEDAGVKVLSGSVIVGGDWRNPATSPPTTVAANDGGGILVLGGTATFASGRIGSAANPALANLGNGVTVKAGGAFYVAGPDWSVISPARQPISGNTGDGVSYEDNATGQIIGASITGNGGAGVRAGDARSAAGPGILIEDSTISDNAGAGVVFDGTRFSYMTRNVLDHNGSHGVAIVGGGAGIQVSGGISLSSPRFSNNVITRNGGSGVFIQGPDTASNLVNFAEIRGNAGDGVTIVDSSNNIVGDNTRQSGNTITANGGDGVAVRSGRNNRLQVNLIYGNAGQGIDLADDGPTANDPGDADAGADDLQNYPVITSAVREGNDTTITGTINTLPGSTVVLHFFADLPPAAPGGAFVPEGRYYLGTTTVETDEEGNAAFHVTPNRAFGYDVAPVGSVITATATIESGNPGTRRPGNTSEFSPGTPLTGAPTDRLVRVYLVSRSWTEAFRQGLEDRGLGNRVMGYLVQEGDVLNLRALPWGDIDTVIMEFSVGTTVPAAAVSARDAQGELTGFRTFASSGNLVEWGLPRALAPGYVTFSVDADQVTSAVDGSKLDGEWRGAFPTGDATPGGDLSIRFAVLPGDVNRDGKVNAVDLGQVRARQLSGANNTDVPGSTYSPYHDVNASGRIDAVDLGLVRAKQLTTLPPTAVLLATTRRKAISMLE